MTGLQLMQAMMTGKLPAPSITRTIPMTMTQAQFGAVNFEAHADENHLNPMGAVHGGVAATILDSATACAVHSALGDKESYATIDLQIKMVRPLPMYETIYAEGKLQNMSKSIAISEAKLTNKAGKLLATATCTCLIKR
ncbi:PaaI family thioesterase [Shewanella intestini]|uniref:PaaI family thioesterase n=1 Tax=Shewanella intestini TaxID=2017544 RepID=A0ABS5HZP0_9GAMM|nr:MULTISPECIES: PaaI family thioesterase [Shewanella]MBR9727247.1 PaaI family thioesterase [Shewanella intestini]MRG36049.1 hotdog fold thioesterase [Shewanella sp. XMDDZSB0408]